MRRRPYSNGLKDETPKARKSRWLFKRRRGAEAKRSASRRERIGSSTRRERHILEAGPSGPLQATPLLNGHQNRPLNSL